MWTPEVSFKKIAEHTTRYSAAAPIGSNKIVRTMLFFTERPKENTGCEGIETTVGKRRILFAGYVARMEKRWLPKQVTFGEIKSVADGNTFNGQNKDRIMCVLEDMTKFNIKRDGWTTTAVEEEVD